MSKGLRVNPLSKWIIIQSYGVSWCKGYASHLELSKGLWLVKV